MSQRRSAHGQVALVAGGSRGLGLLVARELAAQGANVAVCARDQAELDRARHQLLVDGRTIATFPCDVTDPAAVTALLGSVEETLGPVDILVNVAGIIQVGPSSAMVRDDFETAMATMFWGPFDLTNAVLSSMRRRRSGRIATITSIGGKIAVPHLLPYSAAKFAAVGYFEGLRAELAGSGVSVTTVVPGLMRTGSHLHAQFVGDQTREFAWFGLGASLPLVSMDAERAARRIVRGVLAGRREIQLTPVTKLATRLHGVAPTTTIAALGLMSRLLPADDRRQGAGDSGRVVEGHAAEQRLGSALFERLSVLGRRSALRFNEIPPRQ